MSFMDVFYLLTVLFASLAIFAIMMRKPPAAAGGGGRSLVSVGVRTVDAGIIATSARLTRSPA